MWAQENIMGRNNKVVSITLIAHEAGPQQGPLL